jgi:alkanesulfonate monooxygenase SsuD/methylene tetrahydromethanopterin reductase-like flavin-dependent oxidoreductase (luciferase family)
MAARRPLSFGISPVPYAGDYAQIVEQVLTAERLGLELVGIQDHPYQRRFLDTFALIGDLLARTSRITIFPDVASLPMRPPTMLAKASVSLDVMSGARFELGIGAGAFWDAIVGMGGPRRTPREALAALEEAIHILRGAFDVGPEKRVVKGSGSSYPVPGYPPGPPPGHRIEVWVGAMGPRMLELIGRLADGWVPGSGVQRVRDFPRLSARIDEAAVAAGRNPAAVRKIVNLSGTITSGERGEGPLDGPVEHWIERLAHWATELTIDSFIFWPGDGGTQQIELYAQEVVPGVRAAAAR